MALRILANVETKIEDPQRSDALGWLLRRARILREAAERRRKGFEHKASQKRSHRRSEFVEACDQGLLN
jgi:hypothetical protein